MPHLRVAAYVKLAKLWERSRHDALAYQNQYYQMKFADNPNMQLVGVYVDITGKKEIRNRPEMLRLLRDCTSGKIDCIATQTQAYLAANSKEFFYLMKFVLELSPPIEIITEDSNYSIAEYRKQVCWVVPKYIRDVERQYRGRNEEAPSLRIYQ